MIKVLQSDTIIDVVNKINNSEDKELLIEFPFWHSILNNYMSLKILKNKAWEKRITILTHDISSKKIGAPLWINYSLVKDSEFHKEKNLKQELLKHNFTFFEYFIFAIKKYISRFVQFLGKKTWINTLKYYNPYNRVRKSWVLFLLFWLMTSIWMLVFIFYFAVSKTFIEIIPEISVKTKAINIIYEETAGELSMISNELKVPIKKISQSVTLDYTHKTTGIDYDATGRAIWEVIFINELKEEQVFRPSTRLLNKDGLIFETQDWVRIPGRTLNGSWETVLWTTTAKVIARIYDNDGQFIGSKWNLKEENLFTFPWLRFSQDKIYAKSVGEFTGWEDNIAYIVSDNDEKNAKQILEEMLEKQAMSTLKAKIEEDNKIFWVKYEILPIKDVLKYKNFSIKTIPKEIKPWEKIETFTLQGEITLETYVYNKTSVLNLMRNVINDSLLSWTDKLIMIDENSLRMTVILDKINNPLTIKSTTEVDIGLSYDFDNNANNYNQRLKALILWLNNDEAKNILLNEWKISNINIKNTPFFIKRVSSNVDNIIMKIRSN